MKYTYILCDDGGASNWETDALMSVGSQFSHEYGTYRVDEIFKENDNLVIMCERIHRFSDDDIVARLKTKEELINIIILHPAVRETDILFLGEDEQYNRNYLDDTFHAGELERMVAQLYSL